MEAAKQLVTATKYVKENTGNNTSLDVLDTKRSQKKKRSLNVHVYIIKFIKNKFTKVIINMYVATYMNVCVCIIFKFKRS